MLYRGRVKIHLVLIGAEVQNSGTIEVLQRYVKALCFLDVFEMVVR